MTAELGTVQRRHARAVSVLPQSGQPLPTPPTDIEKYSYVHRELPLLVGVSMVSVTCLTISQLFFIRLNPWLWFVIPFLVFTLVYYLISLRINLPSRNFDLAAHQRLVNTWRPRGYPVVDVWLPICGEPLAVLENTWTYVNRMLEGYPGEATAYVLDDGDNPGARALAAEMGMEYHVRANRGWFKKAGNLRHAYALSSGEYIAIFDADFAPREDFLAETLPYLDAEPELGIVQSPQYFRVQQSQSLMERGAGAVQELFYRVVQVSRDQQDGAICVGSCAVYRRTALDDIGGTTLIEHSEDVHTGFDLGAAGWRLRYVPIPLATGLCPAEPDSFLTQQYRWCSGSMSLLGSRKFWGRKLPFPTRLCYLSGFCYYLHTAIFVFVAPLIPILLIVALPGQVELRNYLWILPSTVYNLVVFPLWNRGSYRVTALMARNMYGWAHCFAVVDILRKKSMGWQPTGAGADKQATTRRIWRAMAWWGGVTSVLWVGSSLWRMATYPPANFVFLLLTGVLYAWVVALPFVARRREQRVIELP